VTIEKENILRKADQICRPRKPQHSKWRRRILIDQASGSRGCLKGGNTILGAGAKKREGGRLRTGNGKKGSNLGLLCFLKEEGRTVSKLGTVKNDLGRGDRRRAKVIIS